jgi:DegV family protein with EDD domain
MTKIKILTDSTSDLPKPLADELDVEIIPLNVYFGEDKYKDGINLTPNEFYGMVESGIYDWPKTSQPSAKEFIDCYNDILSDGTESVISIHISSELSGTINSVQVAKKNLQEKDITMIDARSTTVQLGLVVHAAAKLLQKGKSKKEIIQTLEKNYIPNSHVIGVVDTLDYLHKGGRIGRAKKILGTLLNKKPIVTIEDGVVNSIGSVTGHEEGFKKLVQLASNVFEHLETDIVWIGYTDDETRAKKLYEAIKDHPKAPEDIKIAQIGPTVGTHLGPGVIALSWIGDFKKEWFFGK